MGKIWIGNDLIKDNTNAPGVAEIKLKLEPQFIQLPPIIKEVIKTVEIIKEIPVEKIIYIDKPVEIINEVIKEVPIEIIKTIEVIKEVIREVKINVPFETIITKHEPLYVYVNRIPVWMYGVIGMETIALIFSLIR